MLGQVLVYTIIILLLVSSFLWGYLELFLVRKLYQEICLKKKNEKISFWWGYHKRLKCMKGFSATEPYVKQLNRAQLLHRIGLWLGVSVIILIVIYKSFGYGQSGDECVQISTHVTVTKTEGNQTTVKIYKNIEEFIK